MARQGGLRLSAQSENSIEYGRHLNISYPKEIRATTGFGNDCCARCRTTL